MRIATRAAAKKVARVVRNPDLFHFVEGLGFAAIQAGVVSGSVTICERRALHQDAFRLHREPLLGIPCADIDHAEPMDAEVRFEYTHSDRILVYSRRAKDSFLDAGISEDRLVINPLGADYPIRGFFPPPSRSRLLFVGRLDFHKGLDVAVSTVRRLPGARLRVAGTGSPAVRDWLSRQPGVDYLGLLTPDEVRSELSAATLLLAPSLESFGLAILEAAQRGLPVVMSDDAGISEWFQTSTYNSTVSKYDVDTWARSVEKILESTPRNYIDMCIEAAECGRALSSRNSMRGLQEFYISALDGAS